MIDVEWRLKQSGAIITRNFPAQFEYSTQKYYCLEKIFGLFNFRLFKSFLFIPSSAYPFVRRACILPSGPANVVFIVCLFWNSAPKRYIKWNDFILISRSSAFGYPRWLVAFVAAPLPRCPAASLPRCFYVSQSLNLSIYPHTIQTQFERIGLTAVRVATRRKEFTPRSRHTKHIHIQSACVFVFGDAKRREHPNRSLWICHYRQMCGWFLMFCCVCTLLGIPWPYPNRTIYIHTFAQICGVSIHSVHSSFWSGSVGGDTAGASGKKSERVSLGFVCTTSDSLVCGNSIGIRFSVRLSISID